VHFKAALADEISGWACAERALMEPCARLSPAPGALDSGLVTLRGRHVRKMNRILYLLDLLCALVVRDVTVRYRRSVLGILWSLLNPLFQLLVFRFVFRTLLPLKIPDYTLFLFIGLLAWGWFQSSLLAATTSIIDNASMLHQPGFPDPILVIVAVLSHLVNFALALPVVGVFLITSGHYPTIAIAALPFVVIAQLAFTLSLAYFVAGLHVRFRDMQYMLGILLMLGFYLAPVFYDVNSIPQQYQHWFRLNPLVPLITAYRQILIQGVAPPWGSLAWVTAASAVLLAGAYSLFQRLRAGFIETL
jgi:lipopolysaccharide transport system permease protein